MGECSGIMIDSNFKMSGSSGDELDVSVQSTTPVELDDEDDSMDSSNMPPNTSSVTDDSKSHTESVSKAASREHTPTSNHLISNMVAARDPYLSSVNNDRSDSPSANLDLRLRLEQDNLRIRNAEQLLSPEILKQMRHDEAMRFRDLRNEEVFKMHFRDENLRAQLNGNLRLANEVAKLRVKETVSLVPPELELRDAGEGVWSLRDIPRGTRYGPFLGKWASEPIDPRYAWEVCAGSGVRGWLDGSPEPTNWMKFIRTVGHGATNQVNVHHFLLWYETCRDVPSGTELLLGQRTPLQLQDLLAETAGSEDRSDRETGSQHSGTVDDEREDAEDEEADSRCHVCDRVFTDVDQFDDHLINSHRYPADQHRCELCPKSYSHRPCLVRHRAQAHGDLRKYPCENCTKVTVFTDPSNLQRHIRTHHVGARSHACPECGKTFATSSGLKQHTHIHSSVKPFQCEVCFKAYTQFSNLCRHKRMHADCRMQIKCVKCGQSFSTVTSLSKHKRFCDSTNPSAGPMNHPVTPTLPLSNHMPMANNNPYHQFLMHRPTATLPFMPPNFNPYPLFHPSGPPPNIFNNALLFGNQLSKLGQQQEDISNKLLLPSPPHLRNQQDMPLRTSPETPKTIANADRYTPPRNSNLVAKVSPPTAEEASSHLRPSPARPPVSSVSNTTIFNNPREELNESNKTPSNNTEVEDETFPKDLSKNGNSSSRVSSNNNKKSSSDKKSGESNSATKENEGELPLDLSVSRKRSHEVECNSTLKNSKKMKTPSPYQQIREDTETEDEDIKSDNGRTDIEVIKRDDTPPPQTIIDKISITSTPPMAYPTPIHPRLLEAMYRPPHFQGFPGLPPPSQSERLLPPPQGPYGPARGFSFLGLAQQRNYELLRSGGPGASLPPGFGNVKPFQDLGIHHAVPSHHHHHHHQSSGSKLKDRYACKFCGKVFPRSANLTRHLRTHTGEQPYKCKYCERSFSISSNLQRHVRNIHNKEKPFKCPLCERCFGQQTNLDRHLKKHDSDDGSVVGEVADSPGSSNENERLDSYFEDIRSFMGKALPGGEYNNLYNTSPHSNQVIDVVGKDEDDSEECNEELRRSSSAHDDNTSSRVASSTSPYPTSLKQEKDERLNNNEQPIEIST